MWQCEYYWNKQKFLSRINIRIYTMEYIQDDIDVNNDYDENNNNSKDKNDYVDYKGIKAFWGDEIIKLKYFPTILKSIYTRLCHLKLYQSCPMQIK